MTDTIHIERTVEGQEMVKVSGTGLAKLDASAGSQMTMAGLASAEGPAHYMSPEQWLNRSLDSRSDVYSLGVMLFEVLTGRVPFDAPTRPEIAQLHVSAAAPELAESGRPDLDDTIRRLQSFAEAGADVLYAPGLASLEAIRAVCASVSKPVNVLMGLTGAIFSVDELAAAGAKRISVGGSFARGALGALVRAAREVKEKGTTEIPGRNRCRSRA